MLKCELWGNLGERCSGILRTIFVTSLQVWNYYEIKMLWGKKKKHRESIFSHSMIAPEYMIHGAEFLTVSPRDTASLQKRPSC